MSHFLTHLKLADQCYSKVNLFLQYLLRQGWRNTVSSQKTTWDSTPSRSGASPSALKPSLWVHCFYCGKNQEPPSPSFILLIIPTEHTQHIKAAPDSIFIDPYSGQNRDWRLKIGDSCSTWRSAACPHTEQRGAQVGKGKPMLVPSNSPPLPEVVNGTWVPPRTCGGSLCPGTLRSVVTDQQSWRAAKNHRIKE